MGFREIRLSSGTQLFLGKDAKSNEELVKEFKGRPNFILHTVAAGSPFCIINDLSPSKKDIKIGGAYCARYSQDWRDNRSKVKVHIFTGKDVYKKKDMKLGTFGVKNFRVIKITKRQIEKVLPHQ